MISDICKYEKPDLIDSQFAFIINKKITSNVPNV